MDPSVGLLKEIAKRKSAPAQDAKKWKSRVEIEEESRIEYLEKEREQEEMQQAKKRRRIGPAPLSDVSRRKESEEGLSEKGKDKNNNTEQKASNESASNQKHQIEGETDKTGSGQYCNRFEGFVPESKGQALSLASGSAPADGQETTVNCKEDQVHEQIRKYICLWKSEIELMSEEERKKTKGRAMVKTFEQTKTWLKPLEKLLRKRKLKKTILDALRDIFDAVEERDYMKASRLYLERLAIGNAPWPMGATMVGIHARAAREKIGEDKIAHVMNDEQTRKYIQGIKRLLTVAERNCPAS
ncbi:Prp18 [Gracilaria domingensis]|nr:Prp18 [Gracilaria domingensis]